MIKMHAKLKAVHASWPSIEDMRMQFCKQIALVLLALTKCKIYLKSAIAHQSYPKTGLQSKISAEKSEQHASRPSIRQIQKTCKDASRSNSPGIRKGFRLQNHHWSCRLFWDKYQDCSSKSDICVAWSKSIHTACSSRDTHGKAFMLPASNHPAAVKESGKVLESHESNHSITLASETFSFSKFLGCIRKSEILVRKKHLGDWAFNWNSTRNSDSK